MNLLLIGSGGREHALGWKLKQSPLVSELISAPGNPGLAELGRTVPIKADDAAELISSKDADVVLTSGLGQCLQGCGLAQGPVGCPQVAVEVADLSSVTDRLRRLGWDDQAA